MEDIRKGVCPLCSHGEIIEAKIMRFTPGRMGYEYREAVAYRQGIADNVKEAYGPITALA
jgi:hypothetical protein